MSYTVTYAGESYTLYDDGRVEQADVVNPRIPNFDTQADVIAGWGYIHKLIGSSPGFYAMPTRDTILVEYDDYIAQFRAIFVVDVSTIKTSMRKRFATFMESMERLRRDLMAVVSEYDIKCKTDKNTVLVSFMVDGRYSTEASMEIDIDTGRYTTDIYACVKHLTRNGTPTYRGARLADPISRTYVVLTYVGPRFIGDVKSRYIKEVADEWDEILAFLKREGFAAVVNMVFDLTFVKNVITLTFSVDDVLFCNIDIDRHGDNINLDLTGNHDIDNISKCIATAEAMIEYDRANDVPSTWRWMHFAEDDPWRVTAYPTAESVPTVVIDAGELIYQDDHR